MKMDDFYITFPAGDDDEAEEEKDAPEDGRDEQPPVTWPLDWQHGGGADTHSSGAYRLQQTFPFFLSLLIRTPLRKRTSRTASGDGLSGTDFFTQVEEMTFFSHPSTTLEFPGVVGLWTATGVLGGAETCCLCRELTLVVSYASTVNSPLYTLCEKAYSNRRVSFIFPETCSMGGCDRSAPPFFFFSFFLPFLLFVKDRTVTFSGVWIDLRSPSFLFLFIYFRLRSRNVFQLSPIFFILHLNAPSQCTKKGKDEKK